MQEASIALGKLQTVLIDERPDRCLKRPDRSKQCNCLQFGELWISLRQRPILCIAMIIE